MNGDPNYKYGKFEGEVIERLNNIAGMLERKVDRAEFTPVKTIAYGLASIILAGVVTAILAQVITARSPFA